MSDNPLKNLEDAVQRLSDCDPDQVMDSTAGELLDMAKDGLEGFRQINDLKRKALNGELTPEPPLGERLPDGTVKRSDKKRNEVWCVICGRYYHFNDTDHPHKSQGRKP